MKILVACEESQAVTKELRTLGHEAFSCDIIPCSGGHDEWHIMQDVLPLLNGCCHFKTLDGLEHYIEKWDMIIAFPPCTHLAVSGAAWFEKKRNDGRQEEAIEFFMKILNADCEKIAVENPVNIISGNYIGKHFPLLQSKYEFPIKPTQTIQPYEYGNSARKKTCLWLKGLPKLVPTNIVSPGEFLISSGKTYSVGASADTARDKDGKSIRWNDPRTAKIRSKTFPGIAKAMAEQWTVNISEEKGEKQMEFRMKEYQLPEKIKFNYGELKQELTEKVKLYETMVYTDEQIKEAKADLANLNKLKKALNDERILREKEYMEPFNAFKAQINEIIGIIDKPVAVIDAQIKEYEEKQKKEKMEKIKELWSEMEVPDGLAFEKVFEERMLNNSFNLKHIKTCFTDAIDKFNRDITTLDALPEFGFEAKQVYLQTLDINKALAEGQRMSQIQKQKAEHEAEQARLKAEEEAKKAVAEVAPTESQSQATPEDFMNPPEETTPVKEWVAFQALMSTEDALALRDFFNSRNIEFKAV